MPNNVPDETGSGYDQLDVVTTDPTLQPVGTYPPGTFVLWKNPGNTTPPTADILYMGQADGVLAIVDLDASVDLSTDVTGVLPVANGGTGESTQQAAITNLSGTQIAGEYLRSDGTNTLLAPLQAGDLTGTVPIIHGGTGETTAPLAINALLPSQTGNAGDVLTTNGTVAAWTPPLPAPSLGYGFFYREPVAGFGTIAIDAAVPFNTTGASSGGIVSFSPTEILLPAIGVYDISFMVSVDEAGQLMLSLNPNGGGYMLQPQTLAGRATGTNQITNRVLITTSTINTLVKVQNHSSPAALTLTPTPGGTSAGSTSLTIVRLA